MGMCICTYEYVCMDIHVSTSLCLLRGSRNNVTAVNNEQPSAQVLISPYYFLLEGTRVTLEKMTDSKPWTGNMQDESDIFCVEK